VNEPESETKMKLLPDLRLCSELSQESVDGIGDVSYESMRRRDVEESQLK